MKKLILFYLLLLSNFSSNAQENKEYPWDIYSVVETDSVPSATLWLNAYTFVQEQEGCRLVSADSLNNVKATCGFWAYKSKLLKSIEGRIFFNFLVEIKENKYRYFINDFHFMPYSRDRYSRYKADKSAVQSLSEPNQSRKKAWKGYQEEAKTSANELAEALKTAMKEIPKKAIIEKASQTDW